MNVMKFTGFAGSLMMCASALATLTYSWENDNKTLVATVDTGTNWLQDDQYKAALNANSVTNLVKRGDEALVKLSVKIAAFLVSHIFIRRLAADTVDYDPRAANLRAESYNILIELYSVVE